MCCVSDVTTDDQSLLDDLPEAATRAATLAEMFLAWKTKVLQRTEGKPDPRPVIERMRESAPVIAAAMPIGFLPDLAPRYHMLARVLREIEPMEEANHHFLETADMADAVADAMLDAVKLQESGEVMPATDLPDFDALTDGYVRMYGRVELSELSPKFWTAARALERFNEQAHAAAEAGLPIATATVGIINNNGQAGEEVLAALADCRALMREELATAHKEIETLKDRIEEVESEQTLMSDLLDRLTGFFRGWREG